MLSRFFINRPIFATVLSILIVISGLVTLKGLPVAMFPQIQPPTVQVSATYPGANARVLAETVAAPIEEQVNGVENMLYMSSTSSNSGEYTLTVTFEVGTDLDMAQVQVQNRVTQAHALLPEEVRRLGVSTRKQSTNFIIMAYLSSPGSSYDDLHLCNYADLHIKDELTRIEGVDKVQLYGPSNYSMRIWLDADKLKTRRLTTTDVVNALREQNVQVAAGQVGQTPAPGGQNFQYTINTQGRLTSAAQFGDIILKTSPDGRMTRIKDVARVELGSKTYDIIGEFDGKPAAIMGIFQTPGSNALEVSRKIKKKMKELARDFPPDMALDTPFDTTRFVEASIHEVVKTLFIAAVLVCVVILVFLQDWRATLIPAATIPISIIGTFSVMALLGISINMFSLFGLILAIGIVVDDAIVVVENTARNIDESGLSPREATLRAMEEVTGPIVATTIVLMTVFIPTAFIEGVTGKLYTQFALTIATATFFSAVSALTLSPALSALLLKPRSRTPRGPGRLFNRGFARAQGLYRRGITLLMRRALITCLLFITLTGAALWGLLSLPTGFVPVEDQGWAMLSIQLPDAATKQRTADVMDQINERIARMKGVKGWICLNGFSLMDAASASNAAAVWVIFHPWEERLEKGLTLDVMLGQFWQSFGQIQDASIFAFAPPAIRGLGKAGGFQLQLQDKAGAGPAALQQMLGEITREANAQKCLSHVFSTYRANIPQLFVDIDRTKAKTLGIPLSEIFNTLQAFMGSVYVNDFNKFGKTYQVRVQADAPFRNQPEDIGKLQVRNVRGQMIPLSTVATVEKQLGPQLVNRFNMYPSAMISGKAAAGFSSGEAMAMMEKLADAKLSASMGIEWTGMSFQEKKAAGGQAFLFLLAILFAYLVLSALYESWSLPFVVVLSVPPALLGTVVAIALRHTAINIYTHVGIVLLIALSCKTAILIAEFAKEARDSGKTIPEAALEAATLRFRPIIMTALTFILGVAPLVIATGAGAASRQALGTPVFCGMIAATLMIVLFVPVFYLVIEKTDEKVKHSLEKTRGRHPETVL